MSGWIGIPLFQTCATLALLGAVSQSKAGLASGTLGMARNVGTAFGIALLGLVYHQQLATVLPGRRADLSPAEALAVTDAAATFTVIGSPQAQEAAAIAILRGFDTLSLAAALCCVVATIATLYIRS